MWEVTIRKNAVKHLKKLPAGVQERFKALALELKVLGPGRQGWSNYGRVRGVEDCYHCHIKKGHPTYVAVWKVVGDKKMEVTYIGTHEKANYQRLC